MLYGMLCLIMLSLNRLRLADDALVAVPRCMTVATIVEGGSKKIR